MVKRGILGVLVVLFSVAILAPITSSTPTLSNFNFFAVNSSGDSLGNDTAFNISNLGEIEFMNISFELNDSNNITGDIKIYFTANGSSACSPGNNQSSICYSYPQFIDFRNGTETSTFNDVGGGAQGDFIRCAYSGNKSFRNYTCQIDEHYNPNVWKNYPLNFSDVKWQTGANQRIKKNAVWKINISNASVPLDADYYKLDFRVNHTNNPTQHLLAYLCNSTYTTGDPSTSPTCQLMTCKSPADLQDDGTKFRGIFTSSLTNSLGDLGYVLITSDSPTSRYYSMRTYKYEGSGNSIVEISINNGISYSALPDGYETEINLNWFYSNGDANKTQMVLKIYSNNTVGDEGNSSEQVLTWLAGTLNEPPMLDIVVPEISSSLSGTIEINWTTAEPNGDPYQTNITASSGASTVIIASDLADQISEYTWDTTGVANGIWNITVISFENSTPELFTGRDIHEVVISNPSSSSSSGGGSSSYYIREVNQNKNDGVLSFDVKIRGGGSLINNIKNGKGTGIGRIVISALENIIGYLNIKVLEDKPAQCKIDSISDYQIYKIYDINSSLESNSLRNISLEVEVRNDWIELNNISEVKALRCYPDQKTLDSKLLLGGENLSIFEISSDRFSTLAIVGVIEGEDEEVLEEELDSTPPSERSEECGSHLVCNWLTYTLVFVCLLIVIVLIEFYRRRLLDKLRAQREEVSLEKFK